MKEEYWCSQATDLGYTKITLGFDNKTTSVGEYNSDGPNEFHILKRLLLTTINISEMK